MQNARKYRLCEHRAIFIHGAAPGGTQSKEETESRRNQVARSLLHSDLLSHCAPHSAQRQVPHCSTRGDNPFANARRHDHVFSGACRPCSVSFASHAVLMCVCVLSPGLCVSRMFLHLTASRSSAMHDVTKVHVKVSR